MANPTLSKFDQIDFTQELAQDGKAMTVQGTALKTGVLLALAFVTAALSWKWCQPYGDTQTFAPLTLPLAIGGGIVAFIFALVGTFFPKSSPFTAPLYALAEGLALGAISCVFSSFFSHNKSGLQNIVVQAVLLTFGVMAGMLALYGFRIIKVTGKLVGGILIAMIAVALFYLVMSFANAFTGTTRFSAWDSSPLSIGISAVIVVIAAFRLLLSFDTIEKGAQQGAPKYMEWFGALGLMVALVWLYLEILELLAKLQGERR